MEISDSELRHAAQRVASSPTSQNTQEGSSPAKRPISLRKLEANRLNALQSTGPRTLRGKSYSRRNALKHGLFTNGLTDFEALCENPQEYEQLVNGLWDHYQPQGKAEEIEVERIAICCWRLKRVWRYENAENLAARRDIVNRELKEQAEYCTERDEKEQAVILQLQTAKKEIEEKGEISQELKQRIFAMMPGLDGLWSVLDKAALERLKEPDVSKMFERVSAQQRSWIISMYTVRGAIAYLEQLSNIRSTNVIETAIGQHAIPDREVVDKILRYETSMERSLDRAVDRLERLQRRRLGEAVPAPLNIRLHR